MMQIKDPAVVAWLRDYVQRDDVWSTRVKQVLDFVLAGQRGQIAQTIAASSGTFAISFSPAQADLNYAIVVETAWQTTYTVTQKTKTGCLVTFGTVAPATTTLSWIALRNLLPLVPT